MNNEERFNNFLKEFKSSDRQDKVIDILSGLAENQARMAEQIVRLTDMVIQLQKLHIKK